MLATGLLPGSWGRRPRSHGPYGRGPATGSPTVESSQRASGALKPLPSGRCFSQDIAGVGEGHQSTSTIWRNPQAQGSRRRPRRGPPPATPRPRHHRRSPRAPGCRASLLLAEYGEGGARSRPGAVRRAAVRGRGGGASPQQRGPGGTNSGRRSPSADALLVRARAGEDRETALRLPHKEPVACTGDVALTRTTPLALETVRTMPTTEFRAGAGRVIKNEVHDLLQQSRTRVTAFHALDVG